MFTEEPSGLRVTRTWWRVRNRLLRGFHIVFSHKKRIMCTIKLSLFYRLAALVIRNRIRSPPQHVIPKLFRSVFTNSWQIGYQNIFECGFTGTIYIFSDGQTINNQRIFTKITFQIMFSHHASTTVLALMTLSWTRVRILRQDNTDVTTNIY